MGDLAALIKHSLVSPLVFLYLIGLLALFFPLFFIKKGGVQYAFTRFFSGFRSWSTKEKILTRGAIAAVIVLFGVLFVSASGDRESLSFVRSKLEPGESPVSLVVIDISGSMSAKVTQEGDTRYDLARESFERLVRSADPSWKIGLVVFSDRAYVSRIPSFDRKVLREDSLEEDLEGNDPFGRISLGTQLLQAIEFSIRILGEYPESTERSLVIISDMDYPLSNLTAVAIKAKLEGIRMHIIITTGGGFPSRKDNVGNVFAGVGSVAEIIWERDLEGIPGFAQAAWKNYPRPETGTQPNSTIVEDTSSGPDSLARFSLFGIGGFVLAWLVLRGTIARRIP